MACVNVTYRRVGGDLKVTFAKICGTSVGVPYLTDSNHAMLLDSQNRYLKIKTQ